MNLKKILASIEGYKSHLRSRDKDRFAYLWETVSNFQKHWDTETAGLESMFERSIDNETTRRQWVGDDFFPKEMMLKFIRTEPEYVRLAYRDLYNESMTLATRVDRFIFYCDELLKIYKERNPISVENNHYHDHSVVMMYLVGRFPGNYALYDRNVFHTFLQYVDAKNIPVSHDLERFGKVVKTINTFLGKDGEVEELVKRRLGEKHYTGNTLIPVFELMLVNATK